MAHFHLFVYGTLHSGGSASGLLDGCELVRQDSVEGTLYQIDDAYPALVLAGSSRIPGEIWRCPASTLAKLDSYEALDEGLFRRVGVRVGETPCWTYVAGPALAMRLAARLLAG